MEQKKMMPQHIPDGLYRALEDSVGREWVSRDRAVLETYSKLSLDAEGFLKKHRKRASSGRPYPRSFTSISLSIFPR